MPQRYFTRKNNIITGPWERSSILQMLKNSQLQVTDELSVDKQNWQSIKVAFDLIIPEETVIHLEEPEQDPVKATLLPASTHVPPKQQLPQPKPQLDDPAVNNTPWRIVADILGSLGNGSGYLQKLWAKGSLVLIVSGLVMLLLSVVFTLVGCILFAQRYEVPLAGFYLRTLCFVLYCGVWFWLFNVLVKIGASPENHQFSNEVNFLAAMHGMMNISVIAVLVNALAVFLPQLLELHGGGLYCSLSGLTLIFGFFLLNIIVSLRINFMGGSNLGAGWSTFWSLIELWLLLPAWLWILKELYHNVM